MDKFFPKPESKPVSIKQALVNCIPKTFTGDRLEKNFVYVSATKVMDGDKPSGTLSGRMNRHGIHPTENRYFSIEEIKRFASFPDDFILVGTPTDKTMRIGNSVPPLLMRSIARQIKSALRYQNLTMTKLKKIDDYPAYLEAVWQEHLQPKPEDAPTVISTFAGAGGSSLGYSMAGFRELLAVEWDNNAVETFKLNFPEVPVYHGDIAKLSVEEVLQMTGLKVGELDVLDGSPPCQGFSTAGKRQLDDPRNQLFREYVRLLRGLKPKVFVMENVSGMVKGVMKIVFVEILKELKASGYKVSARLLNAMYFGVPQSRQRMIFIGVREDLGIGPSHPEAESVPITVKEAILQDGLAISRHSYGKGFSDVSKDSFEKPSFTLRKNVAGGQHLVSSNVQTDISLDQPAPRLTPLYLRYWSEAKQGNTIGKVNSNKKLNSETPSPVISKSEGNGAVYHPDIPRGISTGERKRLSSFPDTFIFTSWKDAVERIGNSVPPLFMRSISSHIRAKILDKL